MLVNEVFSIRPNEAWREGTVENRLVKDGKKQWVKSQELISDLHFQ